MTTSDLIIIGSGPGGYRAAEHAASLGITVTIIEESQLGGTCLNCGCIPTKTLARNAEILDTLAKADTFGLSQLSFTLDFNRVMERKNQVVETLRNGVATLLSAPGITVVQGTGRFTSNRTVMVGDEEYSATNIIIATGSKPKMLPIPGIDNKKVVTSTELLNINEVPRRLCIVGAGVIGMEFASIFNSLGSEVTVVEYLKECLPALDSDIAKRLRQSIAKKGVNFIMQAGVQAITDEGVAYERKGKPGVVEADVILMATGRAPRTEGLCLDAINIATNKSGIITDDDMQTNVKGIYAIGDVNGRTMLAHAATYQGLHVVNKIVGREDNIRLDIIPAAVFTHPEAASVGLTEDSCKAQGIDYKIKKGYYRANGKALAMDEPDGMVKLIIGSDDKIIGCHLYGAHSADLVQEVSALMAMDATASRLADLVHVHPTLNEIL